MKNIYISSYHKIALAIVIVIGGIFSSDLLKIANIQPFAKSVVTVFFAVGAIFVSYLITTGFAEIIHKKNALKKIDSYSLLILSQMNGLMFAEKNRYDILEISALRHLISFGFIELDAFPFKGEQTWGYYLTDLGRYKLKKELRMNLYPAEFCELLRVAYWQGHPEDNKFNDRKKRFKASYKILWGDAETLLRNILKEKGVFEEENINGMFNRFAKSNHFDKIIIEVVNPWRDKL